MPLKPPNVPSNYVWTGAEWVNPSAQTNLDYLYKGSQASGGRGKRNGSQGWKVPLGVGAAGVGAGALLGGGTAAGGAAGSSGVGSAFGTNAAFGSGVSFGSPALASGGYGAAASGLGSAGAAAAGAGGSGMGAWVGPAIQGGAALASAAIGGKGNSAANKTMAKGQADALAWAKEQDAMERARQKEIDAKMEAQWNAEQARLAPLRALKQSLAQKTAGRLGLDLGAFGGSSGPSSMPPGWQPGAAQGNTIASLAGYRPQTAEMPVEDPIEVAPGQLTIQDIMAGTWGSQAGRRA